MPPAPGNTGRVDTNYVTENGSSACIFEPKGLVQFETAWDWQREWRGRLLRDPQAPQAIWLLEHSSCYTLGRGSSQENLLFNIESSPSELFRIDRGGEVTHHLSGQLVVYLVIDLHRYKTDLAWYLRQLEEVLMDVLKALNLTGVRVPGLTGVWCNNFKIASIGIGCRRWVTQHGIALNVNCDLNGFKKILPCGLNSDLVGKLDYWIPGITVNEVKPLIKKCLMDRFKFEYLN